MVHPSSTCPQPAAGFGSGLLATRRPWRHLWSHIAAARAAQRERRRLRACLQSLRDLDARTLRDIGMDEAAQLPRSLNLLDYERGLW